MLYEVITILGFTADDGHGGTAHGNALLNVLDVNDAPMPGAPDLGQISSYNFV